MEICIYRDKTVCAYDITNINYALNYELKKELKIAGARGELFCPECGKEVILKVNDPEKRIPHFAHKNLYDKCPYSNNDIKESEEHKRGKMLLYNYFKEKYPEIDPKINYRFDNGRRTDLFIQFENGDKLAIEFQRNELDVLDLQRKNEDIHKTGTNILWLLNGNENRVKERKKQISVSFFEQIMINEYNKMAIYLDVKQKKIVMSKNIRFKDPYLENNEYEELFIESYDLNSIFINTKGIIECDFYNEYDKRKIDFINYYSKKCIDEKNKREIEAENRKRYDQLEQLKLEELNQIKEQLKTTVENSEITKTRYCDKVIPYLKNVKYSLGGDRRALEAISRYLMSSGGSDDFKIITTIYNYSFLKGNIEAKNIYEEIMNRAGFPVDNFNNNESIDKLKCPYCNGNLIEKYGKFGAFTSCENYPKCKFSFNI